MQPGIFIGFGIWAIFLLFAAVFVVRRLLWRVRRRGFRPSGYAFGDAMQRLDVLSQPQIRYVVEKKQAEPAEDDEEGAPPTV